jgi:hypothetical protein
MPRLRPRREPAADHQVMEAICVQTHRPWPIADYIERGARLPLDHPAVRTNPEFFMGLVPLPEEVTEDAKEG